MIVLFSLVLAVGMLVDNAIVIVENIYRHADAGACRARSPRGAAPREVAWPVITSTLTTLVAFWPLLYWPGIMGQFMGFLPRTLIVVLIGVAVRGDGDQPGHLLVPDPARGPEGCSTRSRIGSSAATSGSCAPPSGTAVPVLLLGFAFLILSVQLYARFGKGVELFPDVEPRNATVQVKFPQGTSIERTDAVLRDIEQKLVELPGHQVLPDDRRGGGRRHVVRRRRRPPRTRATSTSNSWRPRSARPTRWP